MTFPPLSIGSVIAITVIILAIVFGVLGQIPVIEAALFAALGVARLT